MGVSRPHCRYSCLHLPYPALHRASRRRFMARGMLPYRYNNISHGFGGLLMPAHHPRPPARPVSCYALLGRMAASKPTSRLSMQADLVIPTQEALGGLGRWSGFFPSRDRTLAPCPSLPRCAPRHSEFGWGRQAAKPPRPSSISTSAADRARLPLKAFRGVRAISQLDWPFTPTPSSSEHFST